MALLVFASIVALYVSFVLLLFYVGVFGSPESSFPISLIYIYLLQHPSKAVLYIVPQSVQTLIGRCWHYLFHTRNRFFSIGYAVLQLLGMSHFVLEVIPLATKVHSNHANIRLAITCWIIHMTIWIICLFSDAGTVTCKNVDTLVPMYRTKQKGGDEKGKELTNQKRVCETCKLDKPIRSRHCGLCGKCVYRSDHHCVWVNNCIGGNNTLLFHCFLASFVLGSLIATFTIYSVVLDTASTARLWNMKYQVSTPEGSRQLHPVNSFVVAQYMFKQFPRIVALTVLYGLLGLGVFLFFLFHQLLMLCNYTTREFFRRSTSNTSTSRHPTGTSTYQSCKSSKASSSSSATTVKKRATVVKHGISITDMLEKESEQQKNSKNNSPDDLIKKFTFSSSPYNYGYLLNIVDAYMPKVCYQIRLRLKIQ